MAITRVFESDRAAYRKLEREAYRAIHAQTANHKADHFFNFCVTAHSMRDIFLECRHIDPKSAQAQPFHSAWSQDPLLVAAADIANLSKHFQLRHHKTRAPRQPKTRRLTRKRSHMLDVLIDAAGEIKLVPRPVPEIGVTLSDGKRYDLWEFVIDVTDTWRAFLRSQGVQVKRQPVSALIDGPPGGGA